MSRLYRMIASLLTLLGTAVLVIAPAVIPDAVYAQGGSGLCLYCNNGCAPNQYANCPNAGTSWGCTKGSQCSGIPCICTPNSPYCGCVQPGTSPPQGGFPKGA